MTAHRVTRRAALGAGLAFVSVTGAFSASAFGQTARKGRNGQMIDVMLIDSSIAMPSRIDTFIQARRKTMAVVDISLDAAAHSDLKRVFDESRVITGVSSGSTLFCLERIAWNHGFRLTARNQRFLHELNTGASMQDVAEFLNGGHAVAGSRSHRAYRRSHADGILHAWTMHKSARSHFSQDRREA